MDNDLTCRLDHVTNVDAAAEPAPHEGCIQPDEFAGAYDRGFLTTLRFLRSLGANEDIAEEIAQAAWTRGWQYRTQLTNPLLAGAWVNTIARNLYWNVRSLQQRFQELEDYAVPSNFVSSLEAADMMGSCSELESRLLTMFYIEGYTTMEIAERVGLCPATVRVRLMRIRRSLRERTAPRLSESPIARAA